MVSSCVVCVVAIALAILLAGCGGKPFKVKPATEVRPQPLGVQAQAEAVSIQAEAVTDEDFLYETFDANLILAGILPVRVKLTNGGQEPLNLKKARFEIIPAGGRRFKAVAARRAFKRLVSYYEISTYSKSGYKESQEDFSTYALDTASPLGGGETRQGMLFFSLPGELAAGGGLTLLVSRLTAHQSKSDSIIQLKLN